jgi:hypothetical protein
MKTTFIQNFRHLSKKTIIASLPATVALFAFVMIGIGIVSLPADLSARLPYHPASLMDYLFLLVWLTALTWPIVYLVRSKHAQVVYDTLAFLGLSAIVPATVYYLVMPTTITKSHVAIAVQVSTWYFYGAMAMLLVGLVANYYRNRTLIQLNAWWQFLIAIPYMLVLFLLLSGFTAYHNFVTQTYFNVNSFYKMMKLIDGDLLLFTRTPLNLLMIGIVAMLSMLVALVYNGTRRWTLKFK